MDFQISMQTTASAAWILKFRCSRRCQLHGFSDFDADDSVSCMDFEISMQTTVSAAWILKFRCRRGCQLHGFSDFDADDGVGCMEMRKCSWKERNVYIRKGKMSVYKDLPVRWVNQGHKTELVSSQRSDNRVGEFAC